MKLNFKISILSLALILLPCIVSATIKVDGHLDEPEWANAGSFHDFVMTDPQTLATPPYATEAKVLAVKEGLAVAFICDQPSSVKHTHTITSRDAMEFDSDSVTLNVDFDGTGKIGYQFSVSVAGCIRDGMMNNLPFPNTDWDGVWEHTVYEEPERWTVEILIPWSVAAMRDGNGKTRQIGMYFKREVNETKQVFAFPGISEMQANFMTKFTRVEVPSYSAQQLDVVPYVTVISDLLNKKTSGKGGLDVSWKPSNKFQLSATANPDFGQVESDELVINFTAIETQFSDKRPFFTENQGIFKIDMPSPGGMAGGGGPGGGNQVIYTRRIGGPSDDMGKVTNINGALKVIGSEGAVNFGALAAKEDTDAGRTFYAGRLVIPGGSWSIGGVSTYVDRPFINRTGMVNAVDYDLQFGTSWRLSGQVLGSRIKINNEKTSGAAAWSTLEYSASKDQHYMISLSRYDDKVDLNDMGYLSRNNLEGMNWVADYQLNDFSQESLWSSFSWNMNGSLSQNTEGDSFPASVNITTNANMRNGSNTMLSVNFNSPGFDDTVSRGNGLVRLNKRLGGNINYSTPRQGAWKESIGLRVSQEGVNGWGGSIDADVTWYPANNLNLDLRVSPNWCADWLLWVNGTQMGSFSRNQVAGTLSANWFPAVNHEFRLKVQWVAINAEAKQSYHIGAEGRLFKDNDPMEDFAAINFGLQFRYRYEIGPLSDLYVVYSRGGFDYINNPDQTTLNLLSDSTKLRNSDQILFKFRYRI